MKATVLVAVAFVVYGCRNKLATTSDSYRKETPVQTVSGMFVVQTDKGKMQMRAEAPVMERYQTDTASWELFPEGFTTYGYNEEGMLETRIVANQAKHSKDEKSGEEVWMAYGNVSVTNLINEEVMESDTLYWDQTNERIYTDCYVRLVSPRGFMQGYGMESDQRARNSVIKKPFNSYGLEEEDSTAVKIDSINFIGPFPKK